MQAAESRQSENITLDDIATREQMKKRVEHLIKPGGLDWQIRHRKKNGLETSGAVFERNGKLFFIFPIYLRWFAKQP